MSEEIDEALVEAVADALHEVHDMLEVLNGSRTVAPGRDVSCRTYARSAIAAYRNTPAAIGNSPADVAEAEVARLTRLLEDKSHELNAIREARRQEKLRVIDLALELAESKDPGYWSIADLIRAALDQPGHPDDVNCCGGACGCKT